MTETGIRSGDSPLLLPLKLGSIGNGDRIPVSKKFEYAWEAEDKLAGETINAYLASLRSAAEAPAAPAPVSKTRKVINGIMIGATLLLFGTLAGVLEKRSMKNPAANRVGDDRNKFQQQFNDALKQAQDERRNQVQDDKKKVPIAQEPAQLDEQKKACLEQWNRGREEEGRAFEKEREEEKMKREK